MLQKKNLISFFLLLFALSCFAQRDTLPVKINLYRNTNGDSLWITVSINTYTKPSSLMFTATLENSTARDTVFLPVIDSSAAYCFVFPATIQKNLLLQAYFTPGIFTISGVVNNQKKALSVKAILITENEQLFNREIELTDGNHFMLPSLVFENKASLAFNFGKPNKGKDHPDISLATTPITSDFNKLIFSSYIKRIDETKNTIPPRANDANENDSDTDARYKLLKEVKVTGLKKSNIERFNETYSTGVFKDANERLINCLDNINILSYPDCISFLQTQIPGLRFTIQNDGDNVIMWRGKEMKAFYIDEIAVDIEQVLGLNTADIAMVKVYPPHFFGSSAGDGGAVAVYTRRGEYRSTKSEDKKWLFTVKGYSSPVHILFEGNK